MAKCRNLLRPLRSLTQKTSLFQRIHQGTNETRGIGTHFQRNVHSAVWKKYRTDARKLVTPRFIVAWLYNDISRKLRTTLRKFEVDLEQPKAIRTLRDTMTKPKHWKRSENLQISRMWNYQHLPRELTSKLRLRIWINWDWCNLWGSHVQVQRSLQ